MHFPKRHKYHFKFLHTLVERCVHSMGFFCMRHQNIYVARALSRLRLYFKSLLTILCFACVHSFLYIKMLFIRARLNIFTSLPIHAEIIIVNIKLLERKKKSSSAIRLLNS